MAIPRDRAEFKEYCLRALGKPVIDINVDPDQVEDRIDEALQNFCEYHYDGVERVYLKHQITAEDLQRVSQNTETTTTDVDGVTTAIWKEQSNWIPVPDSVISVLRVFDFSSKSAANMFDVRYQMRLTDLKDFSSADFFNYYATMQYLDFINHILVGEKPIRHNQHQNRLYIDMDWKMDTAVGQYLVIECFRKLDPAQYLDVWNDIYLKKYCIQLIKKQWGANLIKFQGVQMLGGVSLNGEQIYTQADEEIKKLEEEMRLMYELPPSYLIG